MPEQAAVWNVPHKEFNHNRELVDRLIKTRGDLRGGCTPNGLPQVRVGVGVVELDCLDTPEVIMITSKLRVACRSWECSLRHKFVGLVVQAVVEVVAKQAVNE